MSFFFGMENKEPKGGGGVTHLIKSFASAEI